MRKAIGDGILMNYVTIVEVGHYLRALPPEDFHEKTETILNLSTLTYSDLDNAITRLALDILPRYSKKGLGGRDCVIIATMRTHGVKEILTHDRAFGRVEGLHVVDALPSR